MPYCQVSPQLSLYYITNSPNDDVALFDHAKPTILLLHPISLDSSWLKAQFKDPRLTNHYNMIAFDQRNAGRTKSKYSARRDSYVDAADLGFAHELLQLPPVHLFAAQMNSVWMAVRFALLFPDKSLSLCMCGIPADPPSAPDSWPPAPASTDDSSSSFSLEWTKKAFAELIEVWCFPQDLETYEQAVMEMSYFLFDGQIPSDLLDEVVAWWCQYMPPSRRRSVIELTVGRTPPLKEEYAALKLPTFLITGETSAAHPPEEATKVHDAIPGSQFFIVKGGPEVFQILPQYSGISNRVYANFLARLPPPPRFEPHTPDITRTGAAALQRLAALRQDPSIAQRDPVESLSFSMWPSEVVAQNQAFLDQMEQGEKEAFSPVDADGRPFRKFSRRHDDQWTKAAFDKHRDHVQAIAGIQVQSHA